jgi:hypothetical protein
LFFCSWIKFETENKKKGGVQGTRAKEKLDDFVKVIEDLSAYKNLHKTDNYSWLCMTEEAELWRSLVNNYPGIVAYIFNGTDEQIHNLYNFYKAFYNQYWNMQESWVGRKYTTLYKPNAKVPLVRCATGIKHRKSASRPDPDSEEKDTRVKHVAWLFKSRDRPFIARWLAGIDEESRERFIGVVRPIIRMEKKKICFQEIAMDYLSLGMLSLYLKRMPAPDGTEEKGKQTSEPEFDDKKDIVKQEGPNPSKLTDTSPASPDEIKGAEENAFSSQTE